MGNNKYKNEHKENGLCVDCFRRAVVGSRCAIHSEHLRIACKRWYQNNRERVLAQKRKAKEQRRNFRRCFTCGSLMHPEMDAGRANCITCRQHIQAPRECNLNIRRGMVEGIQV